MQASRLLKKKKREGTPPRPHLTAVVRAAAFFGLFGGRNSLPNDKQGAQDTCAPRRTSCAVGEDDMRASGAAKTACWRGNLLSGF